MILFTDDVNLISEKYKLSNPFSDLTMENNLGVLMFHCITFLYDNIYYVEEFDAVVIAKHKNDELFCYDIFTDTKCSISDIMDILSTEITKSVTFGFTPKFADGCTIEKSKEKNTTLFVLKSKDSILHKNKVTFPFISRA